MRIRILISILGLVATTLPAFATGHHSPPPKPSTSSNTAVAVAGASSHSSSSSRATGGNATAAGGNATGGTSNASAAGGNASGGTATAAGGAGGQGGSATQSQSAQGGAGGTATNAGNAQSLSVNEARQLAIAPDAIAPNVYPSASCYFGKSGGVSFGNSGFGAGITGGASKLDEACDIRETARSFAAIGNYTAANTLLCSTPAATKYLKGQCGDPHAPAEAAPTVLVVPAGVTDTELKAREKRIVEAVIGK